MKSATARLRADAMLLMQFFAQDLADIALRQLVAKFDNMRHLVAGETFAQEHCELVGGEHRITPDNKKLHRLAGSRIGYADDGSLKYAGTLGGNVLDLVWEDLEARDIDHILLAVEQPQKSLRVEGADIAGAQPAVGGKHSLGLGRLLPIPQHDLRTAHPDFALLACRP